MARRRRRTATLVLIALVLAVAAGGWFLVQRPGERGSDAAASTVVATDPPKTAPPPAPETAQQSQQQVDVATDAPQTTTAAPTASGPQDVPVSITYGGYSPRDNAVLVGGYAEGVVESDGTCTLELTSGATTRRVDGAATPDAATTSCGEMRIPMAQLSSGTWQATLHYSSGRSAGISQPMPVEVP